MKTQPPARTARRFVRRTRAARIKAGTSPTQAQHKPDTNAQTPLGAAGLSHIEARVAEQARVTDRLTGAE